MIKIPTNDINWHSLSRNDNVNLQFIEQTIDRPWDFNYLTYKIPLSFINKYIDKPWNFEYLTSGAPISFIEKHIDRPWNFYQLTYRAPREFIEKYPNKDWDFSYIYSKHLNLFVRLMHLKKHRINMNGHMLHDAFPQISSNFNLTIDILLKYPDANWAWKTVTANPAISIEDIHRTIDILPWDKESIIYNPNIFPITSYKCYKRHTPTPSDQTKLKLVLSFEMNIKVFRNLIFTGSIKEIYLLKEIFANDLSK
jgi:hypothetical protein